MSERAAIVTGASRGIGRAIAETLGEEGYDVTIAARSREALEQTATTIQGAGANVECVAANLADEQMVTALVTAHRERFGRLDVLVNNAGIGIGAEVADQQAKYVDLQIDINLRSIILLYTQCAPLLREAAREHRNALVINMASMAAKAPQAWLSVYAATKAGLVGYTRAMNKELGKQGIKSVAFCPGWVDTDMTDFIKGQVSPGEMLPPSDITEAVRFLLRLSPTAVIPEIVFERPGEDW